MQPRSAIPVFFFAFADPKERPQLPQLRQESKILYELLLPLKKTNQIDLLREYHLDNATIPKRLTDFHNQIHVFHYGGHADGQQLIFEDTPGHTEGLAELLSLQASLRLVFLNGCDTQAQAGQYLQAGVPAVIATTRSISDTDALYFATHFYQALAERLTLREAFQTASGALKAKSPDTSGVGEGILVLRGQKLEEIFSEELPWQLYINEQQESMLDWRIPESIPNEHKITLVLANSDTYQEISDRVLTLEQQLIEKQKQLDTFPAPLPEGMQSLYQSIQLEQLQIDQQLEQQRSLEQQLKEQVLALAELFSRIQIDTERLQQAKEYFDRGQIREADAILQTEEMVLEKEQLLDAKARKERELQQVQQDLANKAEEFLIKAWLTISLQSEKENWFEEAKSYFEHSIQSDTSHKNLLSYTVFLQKHHQYNDAVPYYQQLLSLDQTKREKVGTLNNLALLYRSTGGYNQAETYLKEALQICLENDESKPEETLADRALIMTNLGELYSVTNNNEKSLALLEEALQINRQLIAVDPPFSQRDVATTLSSLGTLHSKMINYPAAQKCFEEAIQISAQLADIDPQTFLPIKAVILNNLGELRRITDKHQEAFECYEEALHIYHQISNINPYAILPGKAMALNNLASLHKVTRNFPAAHACFEEALRIRRQLATVNPEAFLSDVAATLNNSGLLHLEISNYEVAQSRLEEALQLYQKLAEKTPESFMIRVVKTLSNLAKLQAIRSNFDEGVNNLLQALQICRQLVKIDSNEYAPDLAAILNNLGEFYRLTTNYTASQKHLEEALQIRRRLHATNPDAFLPSIAETLTNLGNMHSDAGNYTKGQHYLTEALGLYRQLYKSNNETFGLKLAMVLNNLGAYHAAASDRDQSLACAKETIQILRPFLEKKMPLALHYKNIVLKILALWGIQSEAAIRAFWEEA